MARRFPIAFLKVFLPCYPCRQLQRVIKFETRERTFFEPMGAPVPLRLFFKSGFSLGEGSPFAEASAPGGARNGSTQACRKLAPNYHSSHDLNRPEAKRFRIKPTNLNIPEIDLVETSFRQTC